MKFERKKLGRTLENKNGNIICTGAPRAAYGSAREEIVEKHAPDVCAPSKTAPILHFPVVFLISPFSARRSVLKSPAAQTWVTALFFPCLYFIHRSLFHEGEPRFPPAGGLLVYFCHLKPALDRLSVYSYCSPYTSMRLRRRQRRLRRVNKEIPEHQTRAGLAMSSTARRSFKFPISFSACALLFVQREL